MCTFQMLSMQFLKQFKLCAIYVEGPLVSVMCEATRGGWGELCGWGRWLPNRSDKSPDGKCTKVSTKSRIYRYVRGGFEIREPLKDSFSPFLSCSHSAEVFFFLWAALSLSSPCVLFMRGCPACTRIRGSSVLGLMVGCLVVFLYLFVSWHCVVGASLFSQTGWLCVDDS